MTGTESNRCEHLWSMITPCPMCAQTKVFKEGLYVARNHDAVAEDNRTLEELLDLVREERQEAVLERDVLAEEVRRLADKLAGVEVERETLRRELIDQAALYRQLQSAYRVDELRLRVMRAALEGNSLREAFTSEAVLGRAPLGDIMKKE